MSAVQAPDRPRATVKTLQSRQAKFNECDLLGWCLPARSGTDKPGGAESPVEAGIHAGGWRYALKNRALSTLACKRG